MGVTAVTRPAPWVKDFAPHLAARMLPALFSATPSQRKPRFPGDPWATQPHWAAWYWMHTTGCDAGLYRARSIARQAFPADLDALFVSMPVAQPDQPRATALQSALFPETA